jgi:hypothetical protein
MDREELLRAQERPPRDHRPQRVEYNWGHAQTGFAVLFTVRSGATDSGAWAVVEDITFTNNIVRHAAGGFNGHGFDPIPPTPGPRAQRWLICNNLFDDIDGDRWNGDGRVFQLISGPSHVAQHRVASTSPRSFWTAVPTGLQRAALCLARRWG